MEPPTSYEAEKHPVVEQEQDRREAGKDKEKENSDIPRRTGQSQVYTATRDTLFSKKTTDAEAHVLVSMSQSVFIFECNLKVFVCFTCYYCYSWQYPKPVLHPVTRFHLWHEPCSSRFHSARPG